MQQDFWGILRKGSNENNLDIFELETRQIRLENIHIFGILRLALGSHSGIGRNPRPLKPRYNQDSPPVARKPLRTVGDGDKRKERVEMRIFEIEKLEMRIGVVKTQDFLRKRLERNVGTPAFDGKLNALGRVGKNVVGKGRTRGEQGIQ